MLMVSGKPVASFEAAASANEDVRSRPALTSLGGEAGVVEAAGDVSLAWAKLEGRANTK